MNGAATRGWPTTTASSAAVVREAMEKRCLFYTALATLVTLTLAIVFFIIYTGGEDICTSKRCVQTANELMTCLDQSVAACDDFYDFACGNARRHQSYGEGGVEEENQVNHAKASGVRQMIEEAAHPHDTRSLGQIKSFYRACTAEQNETQDEGGGMTARRIRTLLLRDIGGWPMLERGNWRADRFEWPTAVQYLQRVGGVDVDDDLFLRVAVVANRIEPTKHILSIEIAGDLFASARINTESDKKLFVEYLVEVAGYFGGDRVRCERDAQEIMEFFEQLRKIERNTTTRAGEVFKARSITQLQHDVPGMAWKSYLNTTVGVITTDEFVDVPNTEQLKRFIELLNKTPKKILANYLCWRVVQPLVEHLQPLQDRLAKFERFHRRQNKQEICTRIILQKMPEAVEECYVRRYVTDDVKRIAKDIIDEIKRAFVRLADELEWLDADVKQVAKEKLASVRDYIAYTPEMLIATRGESTTAETDAQDRFAIDEDDFMVSLMRLQAMRIRLEYQKLRLPVVRRIYDEIEYSLINNILVLPSEYLQAFYVDDGRPLYMNFGVLGTAVGQQLANVFLDGRRYDVHGVQREWSTSQSLFNYDNRTRCLTKQYEAFYVPGIGHNVNASETQQDDVTLLFGKLIAYRAYEAWIDAHVAEGRLSGMSYSTRQLFWLATAMDECFKKPSPATMPTHRDDGSLRTRKSPPKLRVVGPLRNSPDFARDFRCPSDAYMNPPDKCTLW